ncbi:MAG TPA: flagellar hook-length control protein FliK [Clostridia bacterium]|nr:flagellar hook-length control protein FliK [Clostridia bacterium]
MDNITMQTQQVATSLTGSQSTSQNALSDRDNASASFADLLNSISGTGSETSLAAHLKKNAETLGAQMNAEMLAVNPLLAMMLTGQTTQADLTVLQQSTALDALTQAQSCASTVGVALSPELLSQLQDVIDAASALPSANTTTANTFAAALQSVADDGNLGTAVITAALADATSDNTSALQAQAQFGRAVSEAQQLLKSTENADADDTTELDFEELQKKVDSGAFLPQLTNAVSTSTLATSSEMSKTLDAQDIFNQVKSAVTQNTQESTTDFTIKLSPEGLGEITVKLLDDGGKMTLSLAASDANVQRLLSSELNNLRDIMRPYNVEVAQVVQSNEAQNMNMNMQQQFGQQFSQQSYTGQHQASSFAYETDYVENTQTSDPAHAVILPDSVLDAYI